MWKDGGSRQRSGAGGALLPLTHATHPSAGRWNSQSHLTESSLLRSPVCFFLPKPLWREGVGGGETARVCWSFRRPHCCSFRTHIFYYSLPKLEETATASCSWMCVFRAELTMVWMKEDWREQRRPLGKVASVWGERKEKITVRVSARSQGEILQQQNVCPCKYVSRGLSTDSDSPPVSFCPSLCSTHTVIHKAYSNFNFDNCSWPHIYNMLGKKCCSSSINILTWIYGKWNQQEEAGDWLNWWFQLLCRFDPYWSFTHWLCGATAILSRPGLSAHSHSWCCCLCVCVCVLCVAFAHSLRCVNADTVLTKLVVLFFITFPRICFKNLCLEGVFVCVKMWECVFVYWATPQMEKGLHLLY